MTYMLLPEIRLLDCKADRCSLQNQYDDMIQNLSSVNVMILKPALMLCERHVCFHMLVLNNEIIWGYAIRGKRDS